MHTKEEKLAAFGRLLDVQERLRKQCPWDRKQTFESLRPNTIEEAFELCDALMKNDFKNISKELGDVLEHVVFYAILGKEQEEFDIADVCNLEADKLMFRHPFINWNEEGQWSVSNPEMTINEQGQVVYRMADTTGDDPESNKPDTASQVEKRGNKSSSRRKTETPAYWRVSPVPCLPLSRPIAYKTKRATSVSIGKRRKMSGGKCVRNWLN